MNFKVGHGYRYAGQLVRLIQITMPYEYMRVINDQTGKIYTVHKEDLGSVPDKVLELVPGKKYLYYRDIYYFIGYSPTTEHEIVQSTSTVALFSFKKGSLQEIPEEESTYYLHVAKHEHTGGLYAWINKYKCASCSEYLGYIPVKLSELLTVE